MVTVMRVARVVTVMRVISGDSDESVTVMSGDSDDSEESGRIQHTVLAETYVKIDCNKRFDSAVEFHKGKHSCSLNKDKL